MSDFFVKGDTPIFVQADVAAGIAFVVIPFDLSSAPRSDVYNMDFEVSVDIADQAAVNLLSLNIYRNILVVPGQNIGLQLGANSGARTFWNAGADRINDFTIHREFSDGFTLDAGFRYSIVGTVALSAVIAGIMRMQLFVSGRIKDEGSPDLYFGQTR